MYSIFLFEITCYEELGGGDPTKIDILPSESKEAGGNWLRTNGTIVIIIMTNIVEQVWLSSSLIWVVIMFIESV